MPVGLQCGCPTSVTKRGGVCPCPPSPFWVYDLPLKASLSTHEIFTLFVQLCVFLKTKIKRSFPISGKRCSQPGCCEMLLEKFTNLRTQLHGSSAVCLTGSRVTALTLLIHQAKFHSWFLSLKTSFSPSCFQLEVIKIKKFWVLLCHSPPGNLQWEHTSFISTFRVGPLQVAGFWCVVTMQINNNTQMENSTDELKCFLKFLSK